MFGFSLRDFDSYLDLGCFFALEDPRIFCCFFFFLFFLGFPGFVVGQTNVFSVLTSFLNWRWRLLIMPCLHGRWMDSYFWCPKFVSRWWFQIFFIFTPKIGEDEPILTSIFFRWVGSTTNQVFIPNIHRVMVPPRWRWRRDFPVVNKKIVFFSPPKTNGWNPKIGGLGRCFSFSFWGYFQVPAVSFGGVILVKFGTNTSDDSWRKNAPLFGAQRTS